MRVLILGAGRVGTSVAENLVSERNDITVIDTIPGKLSALQDRFDLRGVVGDGTLPAVLEQAGAGDADLLIACMEADASNLVACKVARMRFNVPRRIARIRNAGYAAQPELLGEDGFCVDQLISPEGSVTRYLHRLIEFPEALQVVDLADGRVSVVTVRASQGSPLVRHALGDLPKHLPEARVRIVDIVRQEQSLALDAQTRIEPGDEVVFVIDTLRVRDMIRQLRQTEKTVHRVMIAGGGNIGLRLARQLAEGRYSVRLIERDPQRCEQLATALPDNVLVLHGSGTDENLLERESVEDMDTWLALTSDDEDNIMSSLLAKRLGARRVIALINRPAYADLMQGSRIDIAVSPSQVTMSELLRHVRRGDVVAAHRLRRGAAEVLEAIAHGDRRSSQVVGRAVSAIRLPRGASIGAVVRGDALLMPDEDPVIEPDDHVIVFVPQRGQIAAVEKLFQVGASFF